MKSFSFSWRLLSAAAVVACIVGTASQAFAIDVVYRKGDQKNIGGEVTKVSRVDVVVTQKVVNQEDTVPANEIDHIEWDGEPGPLKLARGSETTEHFEEAIRLYQEAATAAASGRPGLKTEIAFGLARSTAKRAMQTKEDLPGAIKTLQTFLSSNSDHYRYFDAQLLLGETLIAAKDFLTADVSFEKLAEAPWLDYQLAGKIGRARSALLRGEADKAKPLFDEVAAITPNSPAETSRRLEAMLGQTRCQLAASDFSGALKTLEQVIDQTETADSRVQTEAFVLQGDAYRGVSNAKAALIAYLRVDVIPDFSEQHDLHAEALFHLAKLWPAAGEPARGADAATRLQKDYANSDWAKQLSEGTNVNE